jgi:lipoprotein-releasing system permease protein
MNVPFELQIALRYLIAKRKQAFISVISLVSTLGVVVGVMALVIAIALMTGLQGELRSKILGSNAHVYVWKQGGIDDYRAEAEKLRTLPHVVGAAPAIVGKAMATSEKGGQAFITIKGIDPVLEPTVTDIAQGIKSGSLDALTSENEDERPAIVLGNELAGQLGVKPGEVVTVLTPQGTLSPFGMGPRLRRFRVAAIVSLGLYEIDSQFGFVSVAEAERMFQVAETQMLQLRVDDIYRASEIAESIPSQFGASYLAEDWTAMNKTLFSALWLEKTAISITIGLIVMVAALNIVASLILLVMEKHRDIAILKTMGAKAGSITAIFMLQGVIIGLIGTTVGGAAGYVVARFVDKYKLIQIPIDVYQISYVPFVILPLDFAIVIASALLICFLATIYPSRQAARLDPAQALRYE